MANEQNRDERESPTALLHSAITSDNLERVKSLLGSGADPRLRDGQGRNALHFAVAEFGSIEAMRSLIAAGVDANATTERGETALHLLMVRWKRTYCSEDGQTDIARLLVESGADVNATDADGSTPLECGLDRQSWSVMDFLLSRDAYVTCCGERLFVYRAMRSKDVDAVERFVNLYAERTMYAFQATRMKSLLFKAVLMPTPDLRYDIVKFLLEHAGADVNERDARRSSLLHYCVERTHLRDLRLLELLVDSGADIEARNTLDNSPLFVAVFMDFSEAATYLLGKGARVNNMRQESQMVVYSVLAAAIHSKNEAMARLLIDQYGADTSDQTVWWSVARDGTVDTIRFLASKGAACDASSTLGHEMLIYAIMYKNLEMVEYLLDGGADVNRRDENLLRALSVLLPLQHALTDSPDDSVYPIVDALLKRVALLAMQGLPVDEENLRIIASRQELVSRYEAYREELERARVTRVCADLNVTYFDVLTKRRNQLVAYLRLKPLREAFDCETFTHYHAMMGRRHAEATEWLRKLDEFEGMLTGLFQDVLPYCVIRLISEYYNDRDYERCMAK